MKITELINKLQAFASENPNLIVVARVHSDFRPVSDPQVDKMIKEQNGTWYSNYTYQIPQDRIEEVLVIEGN